MESHGLPPQWKWSSIHEVAETIFGQSPPSSSYNKEGNGLPFFQGKAEFGQKYPLVEKWCTEPTREADVGDILISIRAPVGPTNVADRKCAIGRGLAAIRSLIEPDFIRFWLQISEQTLAGKGTGTTFSAISKGVLNSHEIPVAPINEQRRIVEKIETLFAQLDKGEEALREVQKLLARYRQSVLKAAVTGQLTADWRARNAHRLEHGRDLLARILQTRRETWQSRGKYKEPAAPDTIDLPELPEGWVWASMEQLGNVIGGLTKNKKRQDMPLRRPMVRVANVYQNRLELDEIQEIGVTEAECARVLLEDLDLLVVEGNGSKDQIGRMAIWRKEIPGAVHQNHLIKVRMTEKGLVEHALWWFQSPSGRRNIEKVASSTSGLYTLSIRKIEALVVPVPSLHEVSEINRLVDEAFSKIAQLESWCATELTRSVALRQSILKDAFAGCLVPQDPADEPAADLLVRIKETRDTAPQKPRKKAVTI